MQPGQEIRLNKFLAERLGISRRQADDLIAGGKVFVEKVDSTEKKTAVIGEHIDNNTKVWYNGNMVAHELSFLYLAMNKPTGYVCSKKRQGDSPTIYELLPKKYQGLKTVGRLDKDSSGLILLTNDGDFAFQMTHPKFYKEKEYEVELDRPLEPLHQQEIADFGITLPDGISKLGLIRLGKDDSSDSEYRKKWKVVMHEGRNRQIRRTFEAVGYKVIKLHRTVFGKYQLKKLKSGDFAEISLN